MRAILAVLLLGLTSQAWADACVVHSQGSQVERMWTRFSIRFAGDGWARGGLPARRGQDLLAFSKRSRCSLPRFTMASSASLAIGIR